ncbi:hypothetical protein K438DRAFT_1982591 [Mycena galopus ATCC 62051]|nr:hypothetical protein K438DRAFT_1982591 [Mycena galopus ATCC 62051]
MVPGVVMHNSGNDAFMCLYALRLLLQPDGTQAPVIQKKIRPAFTQMSKSMNAMSLNGGLRLSPSGMVGDFAQLYTHIGQGPASPGRGKSAMLSVPQSPGRHAHTYNGNGNGNGYHGNGNETLGRNAGRQSALPPGDGWTSVRWG